MPFYIKTASTKPFINVAHKMPFYIKTASTKPFINVAHKMPFYIKTASTKPFINVAHKMPFYIKTASTKPFINVAHKMPFYIKTASTKPFINERFSGGGGIEAASLSACVKASTCVGYLLTSSLKTPVNGMLKGLSFKKISSLIQRQEERPA